MHVELRREPRLPFVAEAEVVEVATETRFLGRTCDISKHGCYVDLLNPLPCGTPVTLKILHDECAMAATASVVFCHTQLGMGLVFQDIDAAHQLTLRRWLEAAVAN